MEKYDGRTVTGTVDDNKVRSFVSAGDLGDLVASLPVIKYYQRGVLYIEAANYTRVRLTPDKWFGIDRLLKRQKYIADVLPWKGEPIDVNLNDFRALMFPHVRKGFHKDRHIADWVAMAHRLPVTIKDEAWLEIEPVRVAPVVINRTGAGRSPHQIYQNAMFPWARVLQKYGRDAVFIGTPLEHEMFCAVQGEIPFHPTATLFEAAQVIAGADLFVGNQSVCNMISEGLKKRIVLEVWMAGQNSSVHRDGVSLGYDHTVKLPDI